ncbi:glutathione S-transferase [Microcoleus sp. FACHB-68]|uniref:glutathione S-transferase n=1 Tax=Microcoleus sp. FACHB-68 TaxID=2692826 RepID=UPI00168816A2|nr:glutathione S-transferase [Microcoleus sp. FACHB-68]MBD1938168.1 glutathione S-transferase [Microcoleus sp. FACHB-68]
MKRIPLLKFGAGFGVLLGLTLGSVEPAFSLPPAEEIPEEILRTEIFTEARSPVDGKPLTAAEYAELKAQLETGPTPRLSSEVRHVIFQLRVRRLIRTIIPFNIVP